MRAMRPYIPVFVAAALLLVSCSGPPADATGREIYLEVCARCHGPDLEGGVGPALGPGSNASNQDDEYLHSTIRDGRGRMPSFRQTLDSDQIDRVVEYLRSVQRDG